MSGEGPPELAPTGERLVPEAQHGELVHAEHLARYRLAAQLAPGRRALDAACGEGYGTALLAAAGADTTGVDVDEATVAHARTRYPAASFEVADVAALPFEPDAFDLAVSFETIEHVPDPERALDELARVLRPDGLLVISTPNADEYTVDNEFHVRELTPDEFVGLLRPRFGAIRLLYQQNWLASAVLEADALAEDGGERPLELDLRKVAGVAPGRELYTVAVCGAEVDVPLRAAAVATGVYEAHELARRLGEAERTAHRWHDATLDLQRTNEAMRASLSWRLTKPLRLPRRLIGRRGY